MTDATVEVPILCHLLQKADSLEKTLVMRKIEGNRRRGWQRMRWLDSITNSMDVEFQQALGDSEGQGSPMIGSVHGVTKSQTRLND